MKKSTMRLDHALCDICGVDPEIIFDAPSKRGPWGYFCVSCLRTHANPGPSLGSEHNNRPAPPAEQKLTFSEWMRATDRIFEKQVGLDIDSVMGDWNSRDMFDDGMSPSEAAGTLASELGSEYEGMLL